MKPQRRQGPDLGAWISDERLGQVLNQFKNKKISVLGDVGIDRYTQGTVERISPEAPVPIVLVQSENLKLGLAANVADNVHALSGRADVCGIIGQDEDARDLVKMLKHQGVKTTNLVVDKKRRTILKERIVAETQQMLRVDFETVAPIAKETHARIKRKALVSARFGDAVIIEDYAKGMFSEELIEAVVQVAKKRKVPVLVDPHVKTPVEWYQNVTLLTPNKKEAEALCGFRILNSQDLKKAGDWIIKKTKAQSLVITLGKDGMAVFLGEGRPPFTIPTYAQEVYDVSGAGDTVISVLAMGLASGANLIESAFIANLAAGVEVSKRGTATVSISEIFEAYHRWA